MTMTFDALLDTYRALSDSERVKGSYLEQMVRQYLENDGVQAPQYKKVWLWRDWPERNGKSDNGIDLVAEREDGGTTAIQVKFYSETHSITKSDIDSFMSASGKNAFSHRLIVSTTPLWSPNAEQMLDDQQIPVQRIGLTDFRNSNIDWATYELMDPSKAPKILDKKVLREHQHEAVTAALKGFQEHDRGKLIMACGTGKTFTALKIAEGVAEQEGHARILFMVPSLALMSQTIKEWSDETSIPMHAYAVCSDVKVGRLKNADLTDVAIHDLQIPATTSGKTLVDAMGMRELDDGMTVVFSTYQSIDAVSAAQKAGMPDFDLIICDEAHRTTGVTLAKEDDSHFVKVHNNQIVAGTKRLYMTATPRLFNDDTKNAAQERDAVLCSMDDLDLYGPVFYRIGFGEAVTQKLLSDYKVLILGVEQSQVASSFQPQLANSDMELQIDDVAKLIGCWNGLAKRRSGTHEESFGDDVAPMKRAIAFNRDIKSSQLVAGEFEDLVRVHLSNLENDDPTDDLRVEVKHIDGGDNAVKRADRLDWLKAETDATSPVCRILSNARCLTEGVDVPSLDAVLFLNPRNSMVDVIQAVGRVMRRSEGKKFGYIILPIAIPDGMSTSEALKDNNRYKVVWQVLQALRAHDERMDTAINQIDLNHNAPESIVVRTVDLNPRKKPSLNDKPEPDPVSPSVRFQPEFGFPVETWKDSVYAKIVDKCGSRMYWEDWAKDIAAIAGKHIVLINTMLAEADGEHRSAFNEFITGLQQNLNPDIDEAQAVEMLAQHLVTKPVFDAMFSDSNFTDHNPVSVSMQKILNQLDSNAAFEKERTGLESFYASVRKRVAGIDNAAAKQKIIVELYDKFFRAAFPRVADRLGIVFTPVAVVDYILRSADAALRLEFGKRISDQGVSVLEPFVGTGTFVTRLLQSGLIRPEDLHRKYTQELFANEIVLLSYYIAAINIETVYSEVAAAAGIGGGYVPFDGITLTDTFQLNESDNAVESMVFPENSERVKIQKSQDIRVIVMNPPYSAGQTIANENNQNQKYPRLDASIARTYAARSTATLKNKLYDSYVRGIRWASNRIKDDGVIAFVSNGSFIDGNTADGLRKTFADEFSRIFVYNLRGGIRGKSGDAAKREGGNVFPIMTPVAICILIKNSSKTGPVEIHYREIDDYLTREQKLDVLDSEVSLSGTDWESVTPNEYGDWVNHRDENYGSYQGIGDKATKGQATSIGIFKNYSNGLKSNRDAWVYGYSRERVEANVNAMICFYNAEVKRYQETVALQEAVSPVKDVIRFDSTQFSWDEVNKSDVRKGKLGTFKPENMVLATYRPFTRQWLYFDQTSQFNNRAYQLPKLFPTPKHPNLGFFLPAPGNLAPNFFTLMTGVVPDLGACGVSAAQLFTLYTYEPVTTGHIDLLDAADSVLVHGYLRRNNITDATLTQYQEAYADTGISREAIFYYVYGLLHSPQYKDRYSADVKKMLPRIPRAKDFWGFSAAGRELSEIHLSYESATPYPLDELCDAPMTEHQNPYDFYRVQRMSFGSRTDRTRINYNEHIILEGIPEATFDYVLGARSAIEWVMDRYRVTTHKDSQITNDPNDYSVESGNPRYIIDLIKRIVTVSLETNRIVAALPAFEIALECSQD